MLCLAGRVLTLKEVQVDLLEDNERPDKDWDENYIPWQSDGEGAQSIVAPSKIFLPNHRSCTRIYVHLK